MLNSGLKNILVTIVDYERKEYTFELRDWIGTIAGLEHQHIEVMIEGQYEILTIETSTLLHLQLVKDKVQGVWL